MKTISYLSRKVKQYCACDFMDCVAFRAMEHKGCSQLSAEVAAHLLFRLTLKPPSLHWATAKTMATDWADAEAAEDTTPQRPHLEDTN